MRNKKRPKSRRSKWDEYEKLKARIDPSLSYEEYQRLVKALAKKLGI